jgi:hypothetical protein
MNVYVCIHIYTHTYICTNIYLYSKHPVTHPCVYMYACAPCPPRHDSPLTPPIQQTAGTPLSVAARKGQTDLVLALLQAGATVDTKCRVRDDLLSLMSRTLAVFLSLSSFALFFLPFFFCCSLLLERMCICFRIRVSSLGFRLV